MEAPERERKLKIVNLCKRLTAAALVAYNKIPQVAFRRCPKVPVKLHDDSPKLQEKDAVRYLHQCYHGRNRLAVSGGPLSTVAHEAEIQRVGQALADLYNRSVRERKVRNQSKRSKPSPVANGGSSAQASSAPKPARRVRILPEFKVKRDQLRLYLAALQANHPDTVARYIYGLLDFRMRAAPSASSSASSRVGGDSSGGPAASAVSVSVERTNDPAVWHTVLARHLFAVLNTFPEMGKQYGYDIRRPRANMQIFWNTVLNPFFKWVCADWGISDRTGREAVMGAVRGKLISMLEAPGDHDLQAGIRSGRSSGNTSEADGGASTGDNSGEDADASMDDDGARSASPGGDMDEDADTGVGEADGDEDEDEDDEARSAFSAH